VVCGVKRRVRARVKARCRGLQDFYPLLWAVHSEPAPLVSQSAVDSSIDRFYSQRDALAQVRHWGGSTTREGTVCSGGGGEAGAFLAGLLTVIGLCVCVCMWCGRVWATAWRLPSPRCVLKAQ
jgi:hypothetical protein